MRFKFALLCLLAAVPARALKTEMLVIPKGSAVASVGGAQSLPLEVVSEQAMVRISSGSNARATLASGGYLILTEFPSIDWALVSLPAGMRVADGLALLKAMPGILDVAANRILIPIRQASDPSINTQVSLSQIDAQGAWDYDVGTSCRATVVVVDAGVEGTHPDLQAKIVNSGAVSSQYCASGGAACVATPVPTPACDHGTQVAGIAAATSDNGVGIAGVSWGAQILSIKVFDDGACNPVGGCPNTCTTSDAALTNAVTYATGIQNTAEAGKVVINMSVGCAPGSAGCPATCNAGLQAALAAATAVGIPVVIASGNDGGAVNSPAFCAGTGGGSGIIPAGAVNNSNVLESFSSRGPELAANGVAAPGRSVYTTTVGGSYTGGATGTSFASPHVAGLAALVLSARPTMTAAQVQTAIRAGAENIGVASASQGAGRINAYKTMRVAVKGTLAGFDGQEKPIAFPNPYHTSNIGAVSFSIPPSLQGAMMKIKIYTLDGQIVRELGGGLTWDGKNTDGKLVASGTYVFSVTSSAGTGRGRVAVIR